MLFLRTFCLLLGQVMALHDAHARDDVLMCADEAIDEMSIDDERVNRSFARGCHGNSTGVSVPAGALRINVLISKRAGSAALHVRSESRRYDSDGRWRCTDKISQSIGGPALRSIPRALAFLAPGNVAMVTTRDRPASRLRCLLDLEGEAVPRKIRDSVQNTKRILKPQRRRSTRTLNAVGSRPAPDLTKVWGIAMGFVLEVIIGAALCLKFGKSLKMKNTVTIIGPKLYKLLSGKENGGDTHTGESRGLTRDFKNTSEFQSVTTSGYSTTAATPISVTTETSSVESQSTRSTSLLSPSPTLTTSTATATAKTNSTIHDELMKRRTALGYDDDNNDEPSPKMRKKIPEIQIFDDHKRPHKTDPTNSTPIAAVSPLSSISAEMLTSVKLKPAQNKKDKPMKSAEKSIFERMKETIAQHPDRSLPATAEDDNGDWNNANLGRRLSKVKKRRK